MDICFYVLIPVYKAEGYLRKCLDSVLSQTDPGFRIVAVDDGSPDKSGDICDEYALRDPRVHVIHQKNQGALSARAAGISYIKSDAGEHDFIVSLDSDDALLPGSLGALRRAAEENADLILFRAQLNCGGTVTSGYDPPNMPLGTMEDKGEFYRTVFFNGGYNPLWRKAGAVKLFSNQDYSAYYHIRLAEDLLQSIPLFENCKKPVFIPDLVYSYTINPTSVTSTSSLENFNCDGTVYSMVYDFLKNQPMMTEEDLRQYDRHACTVLQENIFIVTKLSGSRKNRTLLLKKLAQDPFYGRLLETPGASHPFLRMLKHGLYTPLCAIGTSCRQLGRLRRALKR